MVDAITVRLICVAPMNSKSFRRKASARIANSRWVAYATAGAASAVVGANTAEADIHYTSVNQSFAVAAGASATATFFFTGAAGFAVRDFVHSTAVNGHASFFISGGNGGTAAFVGYALGSLSVYASRLALGANIAGRPNFVTNGGYFAYLARHTTGQFTTPGDGYVGIKFNIGSGVQYGWVHFNMGGGPRNNFTLVDYAYADPGTSITAGQKAVPEPGSLALLAVGGAGLLAWRKRRAMAAAAAAPQQALG